MDTLQHGYLPGLVVAMAQWSWEQMLVAGFIAAFPDIVGFIEKVVKWKSDATTWNWYIEAHKDMYWKLALALGTMNLLFGLLALPVFSSFTSSWLLTLSAGCFGYAVHLLLDKQTHGAGKRWWIFGERLWAEMLVWGVLIMITLLVFT